MRTAHVTWDMQIGQWKRKTTWNGSTAPYLSGNLVCESSVTSNQQRKKKRNSTNYVGTLGYTFGEKKIPSHTIAKVNFRCKVLIVKIKIISY